MTLSLPPFTKAVTWLLGINTGVYLLILALDLVRIPASAFAHDYLALTPTLVVAHGWLWQLLSYGFIHFEFWHWFGNMLGLWMFGAAIESAWGTRRFVELYFVGLFGASITTVALSYSHLLGNPDKSTIGASGGVFAILIAFGVLFAENEIMMIPFPFMIKAKYFVGILIVITLAMAMAGGGNVAYVAHLGGLLFGYLYVRRGAKLSMSLGVSEGLYGMRNSYYRWKRRRAARKFEVYMSKHDRKVQFDEHGNYIPPEDDSHKGDNGGSKSGWVN